MGKKRFITEDMAKVLIYFLFTVAVFGCALFMYTTYTYNAAGPAPAGPEPAATAVLQDETVPGASGAPAGEEPNPPAPERDYESRAEANEALAEKARAALSIEEEEQPEPNEELLGSEIERLAAMGFELGQNTEARYINEFFATAYCCEVYPHICGGNGVTASGTVPTQGLTVAADWSVLPAGTWLFIEGVGVRRVEDTGSAIKELRLDVAIDTHANALVWRGAGNHRVWVLQNLALQSV